ncbi:hypothetical protein B0H13DRAFT_1891998 [Mycena leptocephala]|nr:hypothetical protein B0H13DRAFT_1891998 [Mycena leptocephala]
MPQMNKTRKKSPIQRASTRSNNGWSASKRKAQDDDQDEDEHPPPSKKPKKIFKDTSNVASRPVSQDGQEKRIPRSTMSRLLREGDAIYDNPPKLTMSRTMIRPPPPRKPKVSHTRGPLAAEPDLLADAPRPVQAAAAQSRQVIDRPAQQTSQTRSTDNHPVQGDERGKRTPNLNSDLPPRPYHPSIANHNEASSITACIEPFTLLTTLRRRPQAAPGPPVDHDQRSTFSSGRISLAPNRRRRQTAPLYNQTRDRWLITTNGPEPSYRDLTLKTSMGPLAAPVTLSSSSSLFADCLYNQTRDCQVITTDSPDPPWAPGNTTNRLILDGTYVSYIPPKMRRKPLPWKTPSGLFHPLHQASVLEPKPNFSTCSIGFGGPVKLSVKFVTR